MGSTNDGWGGDPKRPPSPTNPSTQPVIDHESPLNSDEESIPNPMIGVRVVMHHLNILTRAVGGAEDDLPAVSTPVNLFPNQNTWTKAYPHDAVATVHGKKLYIMWHPNLLIAQPPPRLPWKVQFTTGESMGHQSDCHRSKSRLDYFLAMLPPDQLVEMVCLTNCELRKEELKETTRGELLKWIAVLILTTCFEFQSCASLWSTTAPSKYWPVASFGQTGMSRDCFEILFWYVCLSYQPTCWPPGMRSKEWQWMLVRDFVKQFNEHHAANFIPSSRICVDKSTSRWYGHGGFWINKRLPQYVTMDRNPNNGCEIQNSACRESGVMLHLKLVETAENEATHVEEEEDGLLLGTRVLKYLVLP